ncbi:Ldh family oxidoreductase [Oleiagrimonas sp.]|uniref:Ldh family oxidoreductase n=1 Tax=Oleiagrimonas sp. TaxID=2010330 RepID=UPI00260FD653|nr:Ldh family oxidoreductase [Oleiagrimonas sp.]MDA3913734.1 Ldh family oxidoreductase [Oleiagrimonas sp.]
MLDSSSESSEAAASASVWLSISEAEQRVISALITNRCNEANAAAVAHALISAEIDGQYGHGLSRVPSYSAQARVGKVDGFATPEVEQVAPAAVRIDAAHGFAFPALDLAVAALPALARSEGIAIAAVHRSHHFGQAGRIVEQLAEAGMMSLMFGNSPKAMAFWGGKEPRLGTNPIAFACPLQKGPPLVIDLALSTAARGKVVTASKQGKSIPEGWALDSSGQPTTDPEAGLKGSMLPIAGSKGAALALIVELLAAGIAGSHFGWEASSVLDDKGAAPNLGQIIIAIDAQHVSGGAFAQRAAALLQAFGEEPGVRLPGTSRLARRAAAFRDGIEVAPNLLAEIDQLAARTLSSNPDSKHG